MANKMTVVKILVAVIVIFHLTNQGSTVPVDPPATATDCATKELIATYPKIGNKAEKSKDAKDLEKIMEKLDFIENLLFDQTVFFCVIILILLVGGIFRLHKKQCRFSKRYREKHTEEGVITISSDENPKEPWASIFQFIIIIGVYFSALIDLTNILVH